MSYQKRRGQGPPIKFFILAIVILFAFVLLISLGKKGQKAMFDAAKEISGNISQLQDDAENAEMSVFGEVTEKEGIEISIPDLQEGSQGEEQDPDETPSGKENESETDTEDPESSYAEDEDETNQDIPWTGLRIIFIDVGQGDGILVEADGYALLIDGGYPEESDKIYSVLQREGIRELEYLVASHEHADHIGASPAAFEACETVKHVIAPILESNNYYFQELVSKTALNGLEIELMGAGDTFTLGNASVAVLGPLRASEEPNNLSLVLLLQYGDVKVLFTGDAEWDEEQDILQSGADIQADVLKVGHHGSSNSTGYWWLRTVDPDYAVISVGETGHTDYGQPTEKVLSRLRDAEVTVFRTDMQGDIICESDGKEIRFSVDHSPNANTLEQGF